MPGIKGAKKAKLKPGGYPKCGRPKCAQRAFVETDPPLCLRHSGGIHKWYARLCESNPKRRFAYHELYVALCLDPVAHSFFTSYDKRKQAGRRIQFRFADIVYWFAAAAGAGIVQGVAYDALKVIVLRVLRRERNRNIFGSANARGFGEVIVRSEYTKRLQRRKKRQADLETAEEIITERYDLIVKKGLERELERPNKGG